MDRRAGAGLPLFSCRSTRSWGIGELPDIIPFSRWLAAAGFRELMILPLGTMPAGETSPYAATSTVSIDPIYIAMDDTVDFTRAGGPNALSSDARRALDGARASAVVRHDFVRRAKHEALELAFARFMDDEWGQATSRAASLAAYIERERWWLDDYALYQALARTLPRASWVEWPEPLRDRDPRALDEARRQLSREVLQQQYWQWIAEEQWQAARAAAAANGVRVVGDLPFVARADSPEIWSRAQEFMLDVSTGVPPDAFSDTGQDWGLPTYRWPVIKEANYAAVQWRARRMAALFDGVRVDHVIGIYRTYARPRGGEPYFIPDEPSAQLAQGEAVLTILKNSGLDLIAEDLGVIPDWVRESLARLGIPGCRVIRWERQWHADGQPFIDPVSYPPVSAAMTGTHDTEPMAVWWDESPRQDRASLVALALFARRDCSDADQPWSPRLRDAMLELAYTSGSDRLFVPIQDVFGWRERVNMPGTVGSENWTWCVPWPVDEWEHRAESRARAEAVKELAIASGRLSVHGLH